MKLNLFSMLIVIYSFLYISPASWAGSNTRLLIEGVSASQVINALVAAGVFAQKTDFGDFVSVRRLECIENSSCYAVDYNSETKELSLNDSNILFNIFSNVSLEFSHPNFLLPKQSNKMIITTLDCLNWNIVAEPGEKQELPTCLFRKL